MKSIGSYIGDLVDMAKKCSSSDYSATTEDIDDEEIPDQVSDLIDFLEYFEDTNPKVLVKTTIWNTVLFKGRVKDFDVESLRDYPIPLNYEPYSVDVKGDYLVIIVKEIKE